MATDETSKPDLADASVDKQPQAPSAEEGFAQNVPEAGTSPGGKRLAPPPKPRSPSDADAGPPAPLAAAPAPLAGAPAPRAPMIVIGGAPNAQHASGAAQAWTRPSEPPPPRSVPPAAGAKRPSQPTVDLRSKLGIQRAPDIARPVAPASRPVQESQPSLGNGRDAARPAAHAAVPGSDPRASSPAITPLGVSPPLPPTPSSVPAVAAPPPSSPHHAPPLPAFALPEDTVREPPLPAFALPVEAPQKPETPQKAPSPGSDRPQGRPLPAFSLPDETPAPLPAFEISDEPTPKPNAEEPQKPLPAFALAEALEASSVQTPLKEQSGALEAALREAFPQSSPKAAPEPVRDEPARMDVASEALDIPVEVAEPTPPPIVPANGQGPALPPNVASAAAAPPLPPRPKSEPARLRGGPPRPRASSPGFAATRASTPPPQGKATDAAVQVPGPPRVPKFPLGAGAAQPEPPRRSDPVVPPSAIAVMKIVAVGDPAQPIAELDEDLLEHDDSESTALDALKKPSAERAQAPVEDLEELADEDIAPLAAPPKKASAAAARNEAEREPAITAAQAEALVASAPPLPSALAASAAAAPATATSGAAAAPAAGPASGAPPSSPVASAAPAAAGAALREAEAPKPPPPPVRNKPKTAPSLPRPAPQAKRRQRPPWWEDVFNEDFERANLRLTNDQIRREVDFIEESLGVASGGIVLDLGCGAGNHAVELASRGYGVVGYDLSLYQLALASDIANERGQKLNFLQGDMREMAFEEMFDGIFSWNTSFGYFEEEKNVHVAERVFQALRPGGMFLIDVINRDYAAATSPCSLWFEGDSCVCMDDMSLDFITSRLRVKRSVILDDGRTREAVYSIRLYSLHELGKLLHDVGFRVTEASGHPATPGVFFGQHSPRIIMLAQKP